MFAAIVAAFTVAVMPGTASARITSTNIEDQPPLTLGMVAGSVTYIVSKYGVSNAEALRRLELQRTHAQLQQILESRFADNYAGSWIDQDNGGYLIIGAKSPQIIASQVRHLPDSHHMRIVAAARSHRELQTAAKRISIRFGVPAWLEPTIDPKSNELVISASTAAAVRDAGPQAMGADGAFTRLDAAAGVRVVACSIQNCTPPMRGGLKLYVYRDLNSRPNWAYPCTNGFNVRSTGSLQWQWTLTAGHCVDSTFPYADNNSQWVGSFRADTWTGGAHPNDYPQDYPVDGAILPYVVTGGVNYADYWLNGQPRNRVWAANLGNALYPIVGSYTYEQIGVGWVACHTGATSQNTRCGTVVQKDGGIVMDICTKRGDSGGPLFSEVDQRAYAILTWGNNPGGDCPSGVRSGYSPVSKIFTKAAAQSGLSFFVNTA